MIQLTFTSELGALATIQWAGERIVWFCCNIKKNVHKYLILEGICDAVKLMSWHCSLHTPLGFLWPFYSILVLGDLGYVFFVFLLDLYLQDTSKSGWSQSYF